MSALDCDCTCSSDCYDCRGGSDSEDKKARRKRVKNKTRRRPGLFFVEVSRVLKSLQWRRLFGMVVRFGESGET